MLDAPRAAQATAAKVLKHARNPAVWRHCSPTTPDLKPPCKMTRKRIALNAPVPQHQEWQKARKLKEARARDEQGLSEAGADALEAVWQHLLHGRGLSGGRNL